MEFVIFMKSFVIRSEVLKNLDIVWTILRAFIRAGIPSIIWVGVPERRGSRNLSNVDKNLELSLASFAAFVMHTSIWRHLLMRARTLLRGAAISSSGCLVTAVSNTITCLQRFVLSWSVIEVKRCMRLLQYSSSESGPESGVSHLLRSVSPK